MLKTILNCWPLLYNFFCLYIGEVFPKPRVEACFHEIKMAANSQEYAIHGFDIQTYLGIFISKFEEMR